MTTKKKYNHALGRMFELFKFGSEVERKLRSELSETKQKLRHMEQCYLDAQEEIRQLRSDLYGEIGSTSS